MTDTIVAAIVICVFPPQNSIVRKRLCLPTPLAGYWLELGGVTDGPDKAVSPPGRRHEKRAPNHQAMWVIAVTVLWLQCADTP